MNNKNQNKRRVRIGILVFFAFSVLIALLTMIDFDVLYAKLTGPIELSKEEFGDDEFYVPDYETDILTDPVYLALDRTLLWSENGITEKLYDNDYEKYHEEGVLVHDYFESLILGDADRYNALFSESYIKKYGSQDAFTMQRVYDMEAEVLSRTTDAKTGGINLVIKVGYKIQANDGTVRRDMTSDMKVPLDLNVYVAPTGRAEICSITQYYSGDGLETPALPVVLAIFLVAVPIVLVAGFVIVVIFILKKKKKA